MIVIGLGADLMAAAARAGAVCGAAATRARPGVDRPGCRHAGVAAVVRQSGHHGDLVAIVGAGADVAGISAARRNGRGRRGARRTGGASEALARGAERAGVARVDLIPTARFVRCDVRRLRFPIGPIDPVRVVIARADIDVFDERNDRNVHIAIVGGGVLKLREQRFGRGDERRHFAVVGHRTCVIQHERDAHPRVAPFDLRIGTDLHGG